MVTRGNIEPQDVQLAVELHAGYGTIAYAGDVEAYDPERDDYVDMVELRTTPGREQIMDAAFGTNGYLRVGTQHLRIFSAILALDRTHDAQRISSSVQAHLDRRANRDLSLLRRTTDHPNYAEAIGLDAEGCTTGEPQARTMSRLIWMNPDPRHGTPTSQLQTEVGYGGLRVQFCLWPPPTVAGPHNTQGRAPALLHLTPPTLNELDCAHMAAAHREEAPAAASLCVAEEHALSLIHI